MSCTFVVLVLFLDAPSHLYKRVCPSVRPSVSILKNAVYRVLGASYAGYPALFFLFPFPVPSLTPLHPFQFLLFPLIFFCSLFLLSLFFFIALLAFLDASSHLYMRVRPSVRPCVCMSVCSYVRPLAFWKNRRNRPKSSGNQSYSRYK